MLCCLLQVHILVKYKLNLGEKSGVIMTAGTVSVIIAKILQIYSLDICNIYSLGL